jgi:YVTN family beta-propeller protein
MDAKRRLRRPILATIAAAVMLGTLVVGRMAATSSSPVVPHLLAAPAAAIIEVGAWPDTVAVGRRAVWVLNSGSETVTGIDPTSNRVVATIKDDYNPSTVAAAAHAVWVADRVSHTVSRIDRYSR